MWLFEKSWPFLKAAWEGGGHGFGGGYELVENSSDITVLDDYDIETDDFWKCDSRHIYSVATSEPNISEPLTLYRNDILVGLRSTDTSGWGVDYNYNPNHSAYYSVTYISPEGREKTIVNRGIIYGGDKEHGTVYASIYPAKAGTYRVTINRVLTAGSCDTPSRQNPNFYSYEVEVVPPEDESDIPFGINQSDIDAIRDAYEQQQNSGSEDDSTGADVSIGKLVAIIAGLSMVTFVLMGGADTSPQAS
jgi:hypothetical protein